MKKLLFIRYKKSCNILEGGEQCSQKNYNVLASLLGEENISVEYIHDECRRKSLTDYLFALFFMQANYYFGLSPKRVREIVKRSAGFDYVFIDRSVFGIIAKKLKLSGYRGRVICFFHNVEVPYFSSKIPKLMPHRPFVLRCVDKNDSYSCRFADKIIALNRRDEEELVKRYHRKADVLIPIAFKDKLPADYIDLQQLTGDVPVCLFLGAYFKPNNDGIKWFVGNVLPKVSIRMKIVGKGMSRLAAEFPFPEDVEVYSDVPDLAPFFGEADLMILPIFEGAGMKVKTCESLMYGKNILGTNEAFEGYEVDYGQVGGLCNTAEEFIAKINEFVAKPKPRFNQYSRKMFLEKYSQEAVVSRFQEILR